MIRMVLVAWLIGWWVNGPLVYPGALVETLTCRVALIGPEGPPLVGTRKSKTTFADPA